MKPDEARANARLIAAAPELLAACEAAADSGLHEGCYQPLMTQLKQAIAKATK